METEKLPYGPKPFRSLLSGMFFGIVGLVICQMAVNNDRGLILNGIITFSENGATIFYWILAIFSFGVCALGLIQFALAMYGEKKYIEIGPNSITVPDFLLISENTVHFSEILKAKEVKVKGNTILTIEPFRGKKVKIYSGNLKTHDDYVRIAQLIAAKSSRTVQS